MSKASDHYRNGSLGACLRLLPFDFRDEFGGEMQEVFREQEAASGRSEAAIKLLRLWWETIAGIVGVAPREHLSILRNDTGYALRLMRKDPWYTIAAVGILGVGDWREYSGLQCGEFRAVAAAAVRRRKSHRYDSAASRQGRR